MLCVPISALIIDPGQTIVQFAVERRAAFAEDVDLDEASQGLDIRLPVRRRLAIRLQNRRDEGLVAVGDVAVINWRIFPEILHISLRPCIE